MKIISLNHNNSNFSFKGKTPDIDALKRVRKFADCAMGNIANDLTREVKDKAPETLEDLGGIEVVKKTGFFKNLLEGMRDLLELPFDLIDDIASRFPDSKLNNSNFLNRHREHTLKEAQIKALDGLYEDGAKFAEDIPTQEMSQISLNKGECGTTCQTACLDVAGKFNHLLNESMAYDKATYDTKKERFITRLVSGFTAAIFLGNDYYNSAKLKGKSDEDAKKSQYLKQGQEFKENIIESLMQFGLLSCFSKFVNSNLWASALLGTAISTVSRIISRKSSGMRLTRMKVPEYSINEFQKAVKNNEEYKTQSEKDKEAKKPILSLKNILTFCAVSIAGGFGLRALKLHTRVGRNIDEALKKCSNKINKQMKTNVVATNKELMTLHDILCKSGETELCDKIKKYAKCDTLLLGKTEKTIKLFGKIEVPVSGFGNLLLAPLTIVKKIALYPYETVKKLASAMGIIDKGAKNTMVSPEEAIERFKAKGFNNITNFIDISEPIKEGKLNEMLKDPYEIKNIYLRFKQFEDKYGSDPEKLTQEFSNYVKKMRLASLNNKTVSKVDNSKIAVIAQTTGTLTGMWFNMNDEYNAAIKNGNDKQEAQIAARKRGLNKFARLTSQVAISGALNNLFKRQYQSSMIGSGIIVALSTILTDIVSRQMTAMPTKKMNKEELEKYQKEHKEGAMSWYYNAIDRLSK